MRASPSAVAVLVAALACAACKRAPEQAAAPASPDLAPLPPSSALVVTPLDNAATGFTNEMQAANLSKQTADLGIQHITKHHDESNEDDAPTGPPPPLSDVEKKERLEQLRTMTKQYSKMRRSIDADRDKSVSLPGATAAMIPGRKSGGALSVEEEAPGRWSGPYGGAVEPGERVIEAAGPWNELWSRLSRETPPAVDFEKTRVAAIFAGTRPTAGYRARLVEVLEQKDRLVVRWLEEGPAPGEAVAEGETAPFLLVSLPKDARPVRIEKIRRARKA